MFKFFLLFYFKHNFLFRGALTNKTYAFNSRPWELKKFVYYDIFDSFLNELLIEHTDIQIVRILPGIKADREDYFFISDKTRFFFDGLFVNRIFKFVISAKHFILYSSNFLLTLLCKFFLLTKFLIFIQIQLLLKELIKQFFFLKNDFFSFKINLHLNNGFVDYTTSLNLKSFLISIGLNSFVKSKKLINFNSSNFLLTKHDFNIDQKNIIIWDLELRFELPSFNYILKNNVYLNKKIIVSFGKSVFSNFRIFNVGFLLHNFKKLLFYSHFINIISSFFLFISQSVFTHFNGLLDKYNTFDFKVIISDVERLNRSLLNTNLSSFRTSFCLFTSYSDLKNLFSISLNFSFKLNRFKQIKNKVYSFFNNITQATDLSVLFSSYGINNLSFVKNFDLIIPILSVFELSNCFFNAFGVKKINFSLNKFKVAVFNRINNLFYLFFICEEMLRCNKKCNEAFFFYTNVRLFKNYIITRGGLNFVFYKNYKSYHFVILNNNLIYNFYKTCSVTLSSINLSRKSHFFSSKYKNYNYLL